MLKQGKVPENVKQVWDKCETRSKQTQLLNRLFKKNNKTGEWQMSTNDPSLQNFMKTSDESFGKESTKTYPKGIMLHHFFHSNEMAFKTAIEEGDVFEVAKGGKVYFAFDEMEQGRKKSRDQGMHLSGGNLKISENGHAALEDVLDKYDFTVFGTSCSSLTNVAEDKRAPAIKDVEKSLK